MAGGQPLPETGVSKGKEESASIRGKKISRSKVSLLFCLLCLVEESKIQLLKEFHLFKGNTRV